MSKEEENQYPSGPIINISGSRVGNLTSIGQNHGNVNMSASISPEREDDRNTIPSKANSAPFPKNPQDEQPPAMPFQIFVSYAWGDLSPIASEEDRQRQEVVERLCRTLESASWHVVRDKTTLRYGSLISDFMKALGQSNLVIVVLSNKYLRSPYCMAELHAIYQNARLEKREFLNRIIPLVLSDARLGTWFDRVAYAEYWETQFKAMEAHVTQLGEEDFRLYRMMKRWHNEVGDMLAYVNDVLGPHGFDDIVKDDFTTLRQMLQRWG
jgi:hypothetical protein